MKITSYIFAFFLTVGFANAQEITVSRENKTIDEVEYHGYLTTVEGLMEKHRDDWTRLLRNKGKVRKKNLLYSIEDFVFPQITEKLCTGYTQVTHAGDSIASLWLGIDFSGMEDEEENKILDEIKGILHNYVWDYRKSKVLNDIQNAERAAAYTSRQHQRLIQDLENLKLKLLDTENEKLRLEESIKTLSLEIEVLKQKMENNKADQEKTYQDLEQIRKVLEMHKERLKKLN